MNAYYVEKKSSEHLLFNKLSTSVIFVSTLAFVAVWLAPYSYSHFQITHLAAWHIVAECFSVAISISIFSFMWHAQATDETRNRLNILSIAFLAVAVLDVAHLLTYKGMPGWIITPGHGNAIPFWLFARYAMVIALIMLVLPSSSLTKKIIPIKFILLAFMIYIAIPFYLFNIDPKLGEVFLVAGKGLTGLKIGFEWGVVLLLILALIISHHTKNQARFYNVGAVMIAIYLGVLSELCFTLYSNASGVFVVLGHVYKIASYAFLYTGIAVTSIKLPFKELAKNEELLNQVANNIRQIVMLSSIDKSRIYYVNPGFEIVTGFSVNALLANPGLWNEIIHPEDAENVRMLMSEYSGSPISHEFRVIDAGGRTVCLSETIYPIVENNGIIERITSVCEDVTQKKILHDVIVEREKLLNAVLSSTPFMIGYWGKDLRSKFVNKAYSEWFGRSEEELKNIHVKELLGEELYQQNHKYIKAALEGRPQEFERTLYLHDGEIRHTIIHYEPDIRNGRAEGFYVAISDITAIKNTQKELSLSEDRLLRSQTMGHIGSWEIDLKTGDAWWSRENYHVYGIKNGTRIDMHTALDMVHPDDRDNLLSVWESSLKCKTTYSHEHRIITPENHVKYVWEFSEISYDEDKLPRMMMGCTQDITDRKIAEFERISLQNQLLQSQKMESIGHLTGGVAHDFNNMLGAMLGYTELLKQVIPPAGSEQERTSKYIKEILTAGNRAKELISQMMIFSRNSPDFPTEPPIIHLHLIINEVVNLLRSSIPSTISINFHSDDKILRARIHPVQLHQILLNLAINARDSIEGYGKIDIAVRQKISGGRCDSCHQEYSGKYIEITVGDDGAGVGLNNISKIFDPFYTTKEVGKGTGMGLSVVHGIVHSLGGHINLVTQENEGSAFHIFLPMLENELDYKSDEDTFDAINEKYELLKNMRIMVVDDEKAITSLLTDVLEMHGALITSFNRSSEALTSFMKDPDTYDLIITDETMPELSGMDMSTTMLMKRKRLSIILCTGYSDKVTREIALAGGVRGFLLKPIKVKDLIGEIKKIKMS